MPVRKKEGVDLLHGGGVVADTIHGNIELTHFERKIMSHVTFNRLHDVYQNSTVYLTFPCNRTKRFEHSLGTMKLCSDIFTAAVINSDYNLCKEFFSLFEEKLKDTLKEIKDKKFKEYGRALGGRVKKLTVNKLPEISKKYADFLIPTKELTEYYTVYFILLQSIRVTALLHDIGHPPYSHITEFALEKVRVKYKNSMENSRVIEYNNIMNDFFGDNNRKLHEQMGDKIVDIILEDSVDDISESEANSNIELFDMQVVYILVKETVKKILANQKPFDCLHRIVDGTLDGDRLDYVTRDAKNSGLDKGIIEYERLCNGMVIANHEGEYWFCPNIKALNTVEDFLNRRWDVYKNIIFHHRVIKTDYLLQNVIQTIAIEYLSGSLGEESQNNSDLLPSDISGLWKALKSSTNVDSSYAISQWDDSWLMTVLKRHYFNDYINQGTKLTKQLQELLTNRKHYFSAIKRLEDFLIIDNSISEELFKHSDELRNTIDELKRLSETCKGNDKSVVIDPFLSHIEECIQLSQKINKQETFQGLIFSKLKYKRTGNRDLDSILQEAVESAKEQLLKESVEDVFVVAKKYDVGIKKPLYLYNANQKKVVSIHDVSSVAKVLSLSYDTFPQFFIYILKKEKYKEQKINIEDFLKEIGRKIALEIYGEWIEKLDKLIAEYKEVIEK